MIRAGALVCSSGISRFVSRNGPTTLVASVSSIPSAETERSCGITPALLTSTSRREPRSANPPANRWTDSRLLRSQ